MNTKPTFLQRLWRDLCGDDTKPTDAGAWVYRGTSSISDGGCDGATYANYTTKQAEIRRNGCSVKIDFYALTASGKVIPIERIPWGF